MPRIIDANEIFYSGYPNSLEKIAFKSLIDKMPTVDVVPKADYDHLLKRFKHLIQSDYIKSFDAWDSRKNDYVLDIRDAVPVVRCKDCQFSCTPEWDSDEVYCTKHDNWFKINGYCHLGERRKDAD